MSAPLALIRALDNSAAQASDIKRAAMLRHLTDLYLTGAEDFSDDEVALVDDVFVRLVTTIEESSRALLATRIAGIAKAPPKVLRLLACDDAIEVASPILSQSEHLDTPTLVKCASTKSQGHMLAISQRKALPEIVTEVLVERGDLQIVMNTVRNSGARFSQRGFSILVERASGNDELAASVGARPDLPPRLFEQLLAAASESVREKLDAERDHHKDDIARVVGGVTQRIEARSAVTQSPAFAAALVLVESLNETKRLTVAKLDEFANAGRFEEVVAALAVLADTQPELVERMVNDRNAETLLVLAKAVDLSWDTTKTILALAAKRQRRSAGDLHKAMAAFYRLRPAIAQQIVDFHRTQGRHRPAHNS
jgi:uncharacterized protein (DUF2336 family)